MAEDLTQETYTRAWTQIGALRDAASLRSWLLAIARNEFLQKARVKRPKEVGLEAAASVAAPDPAADGVLVRAEGEARLHRAVDRLDGTLREAVVLHYFQDLSLREVSVVIGVPPGTIKSRLNRALQELRDWMNKEAANA